MESSHTLLAPELQEARKRRRNWLALSGFLFLGLGVAAVEFRPLHEWVQGVRSRRMAAKAEAEILGGNIEEALNKAGTAYRTKPDEPAAIRMIAKVQRLMGHPAAAVSFWKQLIGIAGLKTEDRRSYAEDLLMSGAIADASDEIEILMKENGSDAAVYRLATRWAALDGDGERAREFAEKAVRLDPADQESRLLLATLQLSSAKDGLRDEGIGTMLALGREPTREGIEALQRLGTMRGTSLEVGAKIMELIRSHPLANEQQRILAFSIELALHPSERSAMLDAAVQNYRKAEPSARCAFGMWLHMHREYERMLVLIPVDEAFKRQDLLRVCLEALTGLGRFDEIERILKMKDVPLDVAIRELYLARTAEELGSATVAELHWRRAHLAAAPSPAQMREIAGYAEKFGRLDQAEIALRSLSANASTARPGMEGLLRIAQKRGDMPMLRETLEKMRERWPQDDSVKNDLAYVSLLMGRDVDESFLVAKELVARSPKSLPHRTTLALAALRKDDAAGAISVYRGLQIPWERVDSRYRAVYAAALGANGKTEEARTAVASLHWEELRPEERELVKQWRTP
ncbi:MAG: hypothetical protein ABI318_17350 [Chthoniobacteraceae bacterium]